MLRPKNHPPLPVTHSPPTRRLLRPNSTVLLVAHFLRLLTSAPPPTTIQRMTFEIPELKDRRILCSFTDKDKNPELPSSRSRDEFSALPIRPVIYQPIHYFSSPTTLLFSYYYPSEYMVGYSKIERDDFLTGLDDEDSCNLYLVTGHYNTIVDHMGKELDDSPRYYITYKYSNEVGGFLLGNSYIGCLTVSDFVPIATCTQIYNIVKDSSRR